MDEKGIQEAEKKPRKQLTYERVDLRHAAYKTLVENGVDKTVAAEVLGYKAKSCYEIEKRLEKKGKRIEVATQSLIGKSVRNLAKLIEAKPFGTLQTVKDSTVLAAIQVVLDRSHPKKAENNNPPVSFTRIDLDLLKPDPPVQVIELENPLITESEQVNNGATCGEPVGLETSSISKENND